MPTDSGNIEKSRFAYYHPTATDSFATDCQASSRRYSIPVILR
jgi:hypothetical protein